MATQRDPQEEKAGLPIRSFASGAKFYQWLARHGAKAEGLWVKLAKKDTGIASLSHRDAVEAALCHGWIDGLANSIDADWWMVRFTPRRAKSKWSLINRRAALRLTEEGRMRPAGQAQIDAAQADGRWDAAYASPRDVSVPPAFQAALNKEPAAARFFAQIDGANRYAILYRLHEAKTEKTRALRTEKFVDMLKRGELIHPPRTARKSVPAVAKKAPAKKPPARKISAKAVTKATVAKKAGGK